MSEVSKDDVQHIANLARLAFTDDEQDQILTEFNAILTFAKKISDVDTTNVPPTSHPFNVHNVMRADVVRESLTADEALQNTADHENGQVKVPSIIDE